MFYKISLAAVAISVLAKVLYTQWLVTQEEKKKKLKAAKPSHKAYEQLIGNTALVELTELSKLTGRRIFAKVNNQCISYLKIIIITSRTW